MTTEQLKLANSLRDMWQQRSDNKQQQIGFIFAVTAKCVWNSETFEQARSIHKGWLCQASNIRSMADVQSNADAILIGTALMQFAKIRGEKDSR